ncbi:hypothetical protein GB937_004970 [Aspergillus fischeri]|nr:hypothetical protein GB937_004970 [Aspergillus fischeri]
MYILLIFPQQKSSSARLAWAVCVLYILSHISLQVPSLSTSDFLKGVFAADCFLAFFVPGRCFSTSVGSARSERSRTWPIIQPISSNG